MIYLNNAGTSWPKSPVLEKFTSDFNRLPPEKWDESMMNAEHTIRKFFKLPAKGNYWHTTSCTASLGIALSDFPWQPGDRLLISLHEHHALSRWFHKLQHERGVEGVIIPESPDGPFDLEVYEEELKKGARMVACTMASNITGELLPYQEIASMAARHGAKCLLDGAQLAGLIPIDIKELQPSFFVFAGHKNLLGPQGVGGLYIAPDVRMNCPKASCDLSSFQEGKSVLSYCDLGSVNKQAVYALAASMEWIEAEGMEKLNEYRLGFSKLIREKINRLPHAKLLGNTPDFDRYTTGVGFLPLNQTLGEFTAAMKNRFGILCGAGHFCAPAYTEYLQSPEGAARISCGPFTSEKELEALFGALEALLGWFCRR